MNLILKTFTDSVKYLSIVRNLPNYFDREEQQLVVQSVIIGAAAWAAVFRLRTAVQINLALTKPLDSGDILVGFGLDEKLAKFLTEKNRLTRGKSDESQ